VAGQKAAEIRPPPPGWSRKRPAPPRPDPRIFNRPAVGASRDARAPPKIGCSLDFMARGAQPLQIALVVRAAVAQRDNMIQLGGKSRAAHGAERVCTEHAIPHSHSRPAGDALRPVSTHNSLARKKAGSTVRLNLVSQKPHFALNIHFLAKLVNKKKIFRNSLTTYIHRI